MAGQFWRVKGVEGAKETCEGERLAKTLSWPHLVALGVGAIVGTGIYTLTGVAAGLAGPAVLISFAIAGVVCACAALAYAELATLIPAAGSAYTYSYAILGEPLAWIVGWSLILEYTVACSTVAVGWSSHFTAFVNGFVPVLPTALSAGPFEGGLINLPAVLISLAVAAVLARGAKEGAQLTIGFVIVKLAALGVFVAITLPLFKLAHFHPFMPFGFAAHPIANGQQAGVMGAAAIIFFAFYGFDAVSTAAEETRNPGRDLTIGIVGSMAACTAIYMVIAACAVGAVPFASFAGRDAPLVYILQSLRHSAIGGVVAGAAVLALPSVILAFMYGQSRIFFVMARDRLLPGVLARVNPKTQSPVLMTMVVGVLIAILGGLLPLAQIAALANAGTLCAFIAVCVCMIILRWREPDRPRVFKVPAAYLVGNLGVAGCLYLFISLPSLTKLFFLFWNVLGVIFYLTYARRKSLMANPSARADLRKRRRLT